MKDLARHLLCAIGLVVLAKLPLAHAVDYSAGMSIGVDTSYNDNIRLVEKDKTSVHKYGITPSLTFGAATETTELQLNSLFDFNRFDKSEFNSNDQNIALDLSHQLENGSMGLHAAYINNSTITSELLTSGIIGSKAERAEQYQLSPRWSHQISETDLLQLQASYLVQDYRSSNYTGYKNAGGEIDWLHRINERLKWITTVGYSDYSSDDISFNVPPREFAYFSDTGLSVVSTNEFGSQSYSTRTKTKNVQIGVDYQLSEQTQLSGRLGRSRNDTTYPIKDPNNVCTDPYYLQLVGLNFGPYLGAVCNSLPHSIKQGSTAELDWTWKSERQQVDLNATKSVQPTSNGYAVDAIQISSGWSYQLTELDQLSASLSLVRNRAIDKNNSLLNTQFADRDYGSATLTYQRRISESWFLQTSYEFSEQKYTQVDYKANSKVIALSLNYRPQQWHWSR